MPAAPVHAHTPSAGHFYKLTGKTSGKPIRAKSASTSDGGQIVQLGTAQVIRGAAGRGHPWRRVTRRAQRAPR
jgi:hypothetical protein